MKKIYLIIILIGITFVAGLGVLFYQYQNPIKEDDAGLQGKKNINRAVFCTVDDDCMLATVADDQNLIPFSFDGNRFGAPEGPIPVACITTAYFNENKGAYGLQASQLLTGTESWCRCRESSCKKVEYGAPPAPL